MALKPPFQPKPFCDCILQFIAIKGSGQPSYLLLFRLTTFGQRKVGAEEKGPTGLSRHARSHGVAQQRDGLQVSHVFSVRLAPWLEKPSTQKSSKRRMKNWKKSSCSSNAFNESVA